TIAMTGATMAASLVAQVWMARELGPSGLGAYHATALFVITLATLASAGLPIALSERIARLEEGAQPTDDVVGTATEMTAIVAVAVAAVGFALWPFFAALAGLRGAAPSGLVAAAIASSVVQAVAAGILLGRLRVREATALVVLQPLAVIAALAAATLMGRAEGSVLAATGAVAPGVAATPVSARAGALRRTGVRMVPDLARRSLAASSLLYPSYLAGWLDRFFIVTLVSTSALGAFAGASALVEAVLR